MSRVDESIDQMNEPSTLFDREVEQNRIMSGEVSFAAATAKILKYFDHGVRRDNRNNSEIDTAYTNAEILTDTLAMCPADTLKDIAQKVEAWMIMSPEDSKNVELATCDEILAFSIMQDIQRLAKKRVS